MIKSILTASVLAFALAPVATADSREEIEVTIAYDAAALNTEAGAEAVTRSVKEQARQACETNLGGSRIQRTDQACVAEIIEAALAEIEAQTNAG